MFTGDVDVVVKVSVSDLDKLRKDSKVSVFAHNGLRFTAAAVLQPGVDQGIPYDFKKAKALLTQAGYPDSLKLMLGRTAPAIVIKE